MTKPTIKELEELNVITKGHFVFSSGMHSEIYFNKCRIYEDPELIAKVAKEMALPFKNSKIELVIGPATGGIILSTLIAKELGAKGIWADKVDKNFEFKRGWDKLVPNKNILVVEDVITTGGSINKVINLIRELNGNITGLTSIANRNPKKIDEKTFSVPRLTSLYEIDFPMYSSENCPLCDTDIPFSTELGHLTN